MTLRTTIISALEDFAYKLKLLTDVHNTGYDKNDPMALSIVGNKVMRAGQQIVLRGVSMAGWNNNWAGMESLSAQLYVDGMAGNVVRLPVQLNAMGGIPYETFIETRVKPIVQYHNERGTYVILDYHPIVDWDRVSYMRYAENFWSVAAPAFKDNPMVLFELFNEPIEPVAYTLDAWKDYVRWFQPLINMVRGYAPNNVIIMGSPGWTSQIKYADQAPFDGENIMYAFHAYPNHGQNRPEGLATWMENNIPESIPVFFTEFGYSIGVTGAHTELSNDIYYKSEFETYLKDRPWSCWTAWCYDTASIPPMLSATGADMKAWVKGMLDTPVNLIPAPPLAPISNLWSLPGCVHAFEVDHGLVSLNGTQIQSIASPSGVSVAQATLANMPNYTSEGYKYFANFTGSRNLNTTGLNVGQSLSVVIVCRPKGLDTSDRRLAVLGVTGSVVEIFRKGTTGVIGAGVKTVGATEIKYVYGPSVPDNTWVGVIVNVDGATGRISIRYMGAMPSGAIVKTANPALGAGLTLNIGTQANLQSGFKGDILALAIVDHAMTSKECNLVTDYIANHVA